MRRCVDALISQIEAGALEDAKGWHLYHYYEDLTAEGARTGSSLRMLEDRTTDFNWPSDYDEFIKAEADS